MHLGGERLNAKVKSQVKKELPATLLWKGGLLWSGLGGYFAPEYARGMAIFPAI